MHIGYFPENATLPLFLSFILRLGGGERERDRGLPVSCEAVLYFVFTISQAEF